MTIRSPFMALNLLRHLLSWRWPVRASARRRAAVLSGALLLATSSGCAVYNTTADGDVKNLMLRGHDPVSYFTGTPPAPGDARWRADYDGGTYYFASEASREQFLQSPARYAPQYGGFCTNGVAYDMKAGGDFDAYKIYKGKLYVFGGRGSYEAWSLDADRNLARANAYWAAGLKDAPARWSYWRRLVLRVPHYRTGRDLSQEVARRRADGTLPVIEGPGLK